MSREEVMWNGVFLIATLLTLIICMEFISVVDKECPPSQVTVECPHVPFATIEEMEKCLEWYMD